MRIVSYYFLLRVSKYHVTFPSFPSCFCSSSSVSKPLCSAQCPSAGPGSSQPGVAQPLCPRPEAESGAVHGDLQAQWLSKTRRACWHQGWRPHAEGKKDCRGIGRFLVWSLDCIFSDSCLFKKIIIISPLARNSHWSGLFFACWPASLHLNSDFRNGSH